MPRPKKPRAPGVDIGLLLAEIRSHLDALDLHLRTLRRTLRAKRGRQPRRSSDRRSMPDR